MGVQTEGASPHLPLITWAWTLDSTPLELGHVEGLRRGVGGALSGGQSTIPSAEASRQVGRAPRVTVWGAVSVAVGTPSVGTCWAGGVWEGVGHTFPLAELGSSRWPLGLGRPGSRPWVPGVWWWRAGCRQRLLAEVTAPCPHQRRSWSPTKTPRPLSCRARASKWIWTQSARTTVSTSTSSTSATSCAACGASPAPVERPPGLRASRCRGRSSGAPAARGAPLFPSQVHRSGLNSLSSPQGLHHASPEGHPEAQSCPLASRDPTGGAQETGLEHPLSSVGGPWAQGVPGRPPGCPSRGGLQAVDPHGDPSCLLTPPGTPLGLDPGAPDWPEGSSACGRALPEGRRTGPGGPRGASREGEPTSLPCAPAVPSGSFPRGVGRHVWLGCQRRP